MAKPNIPSQKSRYSALNQRLNKYMLLVQQIFDDLNLEVAKAATSVSYDSESGKPFRFTDYPNLTKRIGDLQQRYVDDIGAVIFSGTSEEWKKSNEVQDLLADGVLKAYGAQVNGEKYKIYYQPNNDALKAFQKRRANGMTLSQKLWNQAVNYKQEMEYAISSAIEKGTSAVALSKRLSKYLHDFPALQKDYKERYGKAVECHDCEYRSMRLARSEINMAYRSAEQTRWEQMDFVVGYEIKLSGSHPAEDICDMLKGKYPKDFVWTGWHPNDMCYKIPILKTEEEFWNYDSSDDKPSSKEVKDVPDAFKKWVEDNAMRISRAEKNGTLPFFLKDNPAYVKMEDVKSLRDRIMANFGLLPAETQNEVLSMFAQSAPATVISSSMHRHASSLEQSMSSYIDWAKSESKVIQRLVDKLNSEEVRKGDFIERIKIVSEIKSKVAILTRWELRKTGAVEGLEYVRLKKNQTVHGRTTLFAKKTGEYIDIPAYRLDYVTYKDKDGKEYSYRLGSNAKNIPFKASEAASIVQKLPQPMQDSFKGLLFDYKPHPLEEYHKKAYDGFTYAVMYSGEPISVHAYVSKEDFKRLLTHEIGHHFDKGISSSKEWLEAIKLDNVHVSRYAKVHESEDFAETFADFFSFLDDPDWTWEEFESAAEIGYPNRWKIIKKVFEKIYGR